MHRHGKPVVTGKERLSRATVFYRLLTAAFPEVGVRFFRGRSRHNKNSNIANRVDDESSWFYYILNGVFEIHYDPRLEKYRLYLTPVGADLRERWDAPDPDEEYTNRYALLKRVNTLLYQRSRPMVQW